MAKEVGYRMPELEVPCLGPSSYVGDASSGSGLRDVIGEGVGHDANGGNGGNGAGCKARILGVWVDTASFR
jgi:hypothetical protein